jgi:hypothetical protein
MHWTSIVPRVGLLASAILSAARPVAADDSWYYEGPLAGSLKSDQPLPLYDETRPTSGIGCSPRFSIGVHSLRAGRPRLQVL